MMGYEFPRKRRQNLSKLLIIAYFLIATFVAKADTTDLILEARKDWYSMQGSEIYALCVADLNNGVNKIITHGESHDGTRWNAQLCVWEYDDSIELVAHKEWYDGNLTCGLTVQACDVDGDGIVEIITGGRIRYSACDYAQLGIWNFIGDSISLEESIAWCYENGTKPYRLRVKDIDNDGIIEIITAGWALDSLQNAFIRIFNYNGDTISGEAERFWLPTLHTRISDFVIKDIDADSVEEIIGCGFWGNRYYHNGYLCILKYDGNQIVLVDSTSWADITQHVFTFSVKVSDLDNDGIQEIAVCGCYGYPYDNPCAFLRIYDAELNFEMEKKYFEAQGTMANYLSISDLEDDNQFEIVVGGRKYVRDTCYAQLKVFDYDGSSISLEETEEWILNGDTRIFYVTTADVDSDNLVEVITGGIAEDNLGKSNAEITIWSSPGGGIGESEKLLIHTTPILLQSYPNPFCSSTSIRYSIAKSGQVKLKIYNVAGQLVKTLVNGEQKAGTYKIKWDGKDEEGRLLPSGIYFVELKVDDKFTKTKKLLLLR